MRARRFAEYDRLQEEQKKLGRFRPLMTHSRTESAHAIAFHPQLLALCEEAVRETSGTSHRMPSGPLHDAAEVARDIVAWLRGNR